MKPLLIHSAALLAWHETNNRIQGLAAVPGAEAFAFVRPAAGDSTLSAQQLALEELRAGGWLQPYLTMIDPTRGIARVELSGPVYQLTERQAEWYSEYVICNREATAAVEAAILNPSIRGVVVTVDSPGGTCVGTPELARALARLTAAKPTIGAIDNMAASAGYWVVAGCGTIYASPSSDVGSVGVYSIHIDQSKTYEAWYSSTMTLVRNGDQKAETLREMTPEMQARWQASVDGIATTFRDTIRAFRSKDIDEAHLQGQCLSGDEALAAGLVDAVCDNPQGQAYSDICSMLGAL